MVLQINTIKYTDMIVNLASSMVFDYITQKKVCAYINYDVLNHEYPNWSVEKINNDVHFSSMPNKNTLVWLNNPEEITQKIHNTLSMCNEIVFHAQEWFEIINQYPSQKASKRIWEGIKAIISKN